MALDDDDDGRKRKVVIVNFRDLQIVLIVECDA